MVRRTQEERIADYENRARMLRRQVAVKEDRRVRDALKLARALRRFTTNNGVTESLAELLLVVAAHLDSFADARAEEAFEGTGLEKD